MLHQTCYSFKSTIEPCLVNKCDVDAWAGVTYDGNLNCDIFHPDMAILVSLSKRDGLLKLRKKGSCP